MSEGTKNIQQIQLKSEFEWILNLFSEIEKNPNGTNSLAERVGMKPSKFLYWASKLQDSGWIEKSQSYPYASYSITPVGQQIRKNLVQSENRPFSDYWRIHAKIVGFRINNIQDRWDHIKSKFGEKRLSKMTNWEFVSERIKTDIGEFKVHIQSTGLMKFYCPIKYTYDKRRSWAEIEEKARQIAIKYSENWQIDIGPMEIVRKGEEELVGSELIAKMFGKIKTDDIYVDASTGTEWLEEKEGSNSIERLLQMPKSVEAMSNEIKTLREEKDHFKRHLEVLTQGQAMISESLEMFGKYLSQHIQLMAKSEYRIDTTQRENELLKKRLEDRGKQNSLYHFTL